MYAMVLSARGAPLAFQERPDPIPGPGEVRVQVSACGVCRTDLHVVDGELPDIRDTEAQQLVRSLGADWAGASEDSPPTELDAAIIYAPVGPPVPLALRAVRKGGRVVCAGIHMSDIPALPYQHLWGERQIISVANLTRKDGIDFFKAAAAM